MPANRDVVINVSNGESHNESHNESLKEHIALYDSVQKDIEVIKRNTSFIDKLKDRERTSVNERDRRAIMRDLDSVGDTLSYSKRIKSTLDKIKNSGGKTKSSEKILQNLYYIHVRRFYQAMNAYNQASRDFQRVLKDRARRQLVIMDIPQEKLESVLESGQAEKLLREVFLSSEALLDLDTLVCEIEECNDGIRKLEQQIIQIHQLFQDLSLLVDTQQESLDIIQDRIKNSKEAVSEAVQELHSAEKQSKKSRKRQCCIFITILMVIVVTIVPILRFKVF